MRCRSRLLSFVGPSVSFAAVALTLQHDNHYCIGHFFPVRLSRLSESETWRPLLPSSSSPGQDSHRIVITRERIILKHVMLATLCPDRQFRNVHDARSGLHLLSE